MWKQRAMAKLIYAFCEPFTADLPTILEHEYISNMPGYGMDHLETIPCGDRDFLFMSMSSRPLVAAQSNGYRTSKAVVA
jgi:hypothetical protein